MDSISIPTDAVGGKPGLDSSPRTRTKAMMYKDLNSWLRVANQRLTNTSVRVAVLLFRYAQRTDSTSEYLRTGRLVAYPGAERMARELDVSRVSITAAIRNIEEAGLVDVRRSRGGRGVSNRYYLVRQRHEETGKPGDKQESRLACLRHGETGQFDTDKQESRLCLNIPPSEGDINPPALKGGAARLLGGRAVAPPSGREGGNKNNRHGKNNHHERPCGTKPNPNPKVGKPTKPKRKLTVEAIADDAEYFMVKGEKRDRCVHYQDLTEEERADADMIRRLRAKDHEAQRRERMFT